MNTFSNSKHTSQWAVGSHLSELFYTRKMFKWIVLEYIVCWVISMGNILINIMVILRNNTMSVTKDVQRTFPSHKLQLTLLRPPFTVQRLQVYGECTSCTSWAAGSLDESVCEQFYINTRDQYIFIFTKYNNYKFNNSIIKMTWSPIHWYQTFIALHIHKRGCTRSRRAVYLPQ